MDASRLAGFPLGVGAPPVDGTELALRVLATLTAGVDGVSFENLSDSTVRAVTSGFDIRTLAVDLTDVRITSAPSPRHPVESTPARADALPGVAVARGVLDRLRVFGEPVVYLGAPVTVDIEVEELPIRWVRRADNVLELGDEPQPSGDASSPRGRARIAVAEPDLAAVVEGVLASLTGDELRVKDAEVAVADAGADAVGFGGEAHVGFAALTARVSIAGVVRVIDGSRVRIENLEIRSRNILAAAALAAFRSKIADATRDDIDVLAELPVNLRGARIGIASRDGGLEFTATLGAAD